MKETKETTLNALDQIIADLDSDGTQVDRVALKIKAYRTKGDIYYRQLIVAKLQGKVQQLNEYYGIK